MSMLSVMKEKFVINYDQKNSKPIGHKMGNHHFYTEMPLNH